MIEKSHNFYRKNLEVSMLLGCNFLSNCDGHALFIKSKDYQLTKLLYLSPTNLIMAKLMLHLVVQEPYQDYVQMYMEFW